MVELIREADEKNSSQWTPSTWTDLEKKRGRWIANAARRGCKTFWRRFTPELPHEKREPNTTANGIIVGLAGLQAAFDDGEIDAAHLTPDEVRLASRYAVNEMNGFTRWFPSLASAHPGIVGEILSECVQGEWLYSEDRKDVHDVLQRLVWHGESPTGMEMLM